MTPCLISTPSFSFHSPRLAWDSGHEGFLMYVDFKGQVGESNTDKLLDALKRVCRDTLVIDSKEVPWFPRHVTQLDLIANRVMNAGESVCLSSQACVSLPSFVLCIV
jgi:hypothetical protein